MWRLKAAVLEAHLLVQISIYIRVETIIVFVVEVAFREQNGERVYR